MRLFALASFVFVAAGFACSSSSGDGTPATTSDAGATPDPDPSSTDDSPPPLPHGTPYPVTGNVLGLRGKGLVLQCNGKDDLSIASDGPFQFATPVESGSTYYVRVSQQPSGPEQICVASSAIGTMPDAGGTEVLVVCTSSYAVKATVSGLTGAGLVLLDNGGDPLPVAQNGVVTFPTHVAKGGAYAVTVGQEPAGQTCTVTDGTGTMGDADVTAPTVTCS